MKTNRNIFCLKTIFVLDIGIIVLFGGAIYSNPIIIGIGCGFILCGVASVVMKYENQRKNESIL